MMAETVATIATKTKPDRARHWSDQDKQTAFEVWLSLGRPSRLSVANTLAQDYDLPIPERTLTYWYHHDQWDLEADRRIASIAPNLNARSATHIVAATSKAAAYLDQVWSGILPFEKDKVNAALQTLDRGGFAAVGSTKPRLPDTLAPGNGSHDGTNGTVAPLDPTTLTRDQLLQRERDRRLARTKQD